MRLHNRYWALILVSRLVVLAIVTVASMVVAVVSGGYWGPGGIYRPAISIIVACVSGCWALHTVFELKDHTTTTER